jgi:Concanavalin A-like lectin/glucanases superfamily
MSSHANSNVRQNLYGAWCPSLDTGTGFFVKNFVKRYDGVSYLGSGNYPETLPQRVPSEGKMALSFDGTTSKGFVHATRTWDYQGPIAISFWQKVDAGHTGSVFGVTDTVNNPTNRFQCHGCWTDNNLYFDYGQYTTNGRVFVDYTSYLGKWTHVLLLSGGSDNTVRGIYLDGKPVASESGSGSCPTTGDFGIGMWYNFDVASSYFHQGLIDDFRIYTGYEFADVSVLSKRRGIGLEPPIRRRYAMQASSTTPIVRNRRNNLLIGAGF